MKLLVLATLGATLGALFTVSSAELGEVLHNKDESTSEFAVPINWRRIEVCGNSEGDYSTKRVNHTVKTPLKDVKCCQGKKRGMDFEFIFTYKCEDGDGKFQCKYENEWCVGDGYAIGSLISSGLSLCFFVWLVLVLKGKKENLSRKEEMQRGCYICVLGTIFGVGVFFALLFSFISLAFPADWNVQGLAFALAFVFLLAAISALYKDKTDKWFPCQRETSDVVVVSSNADSGGPTLYRKVRFNIA